MPLEPRPRRLSVVKDGNLSTVRFKAPILDETNLEPLGRELASLAELPCRQLRLDLRGVRMLSSGWLGRFVTLGKRLRAAGGKLILSNVCPDVRGEFEVTCLDLVLDVRGEGPPAGAGSGMGEVGHSRHEHGAGGR